MLLLVSEEGMIAQDPTKHPGSIIRIHLDGKIPKDNPKFKIKTGNQRYIKLGKKPQGMDLSPFNNKIYLLIMAQKEEIGSVRQNTVKIMDGKY